jgi:hypothetical protein
MVKGVFDVGNLGLDFSMSEDLTNQTMPGETRHDVIDILQLAISDGKIEMMNR